MVLCTVRKSEFVRLKRIIGQCDPNAFVMVNETTEVLGLGFKGFAEAISSGPGLRRKISLRTPSGEDRNGLSAGRED